MIKTESVEMPAGLVFLTYNRCHGLKVKGEDLKQAKRLVRSIEAMEGFEHDREAGTLAFKGERRTEPKFLPMKKRSKIWLWDLIKGDLSKERTIAEEENLRAMAKCLGKTGDFEALIEDTEPGEEDAD